VNARCLDFGEAHHVEVDADPFEQFEELFARIAVPKNSLSPEALSLDPPRKFWRSS
jgi:hypothetical protein